MGRSRKQSSLALGARSLVKEFIDRFERTEEARERGAGDRGGTHRSVFMRATGPDNFLARVDPKRKSHGSP